MGVSVNPRSPGFWGVDWVWANEAAARAAKHAMVNRSFIERLLRIVSQYVLFVRLSAGVRDSLPRSTNAPSHYRPALVGAAVPGTVLDGPLRARRLAVREWRRGVHPGGCQSRAR